MFAVELKDTAGHVSVNFHIMATSELSDAVVNAQLDLMKQVAPMVGTRYYFLVTTDRVRGWDLEDGRQVFDAPAEQLFAAYVGNDLGKVRSAGPEYLAGLTQAWLADLTSHWQSRNASAPGEHDMQASGALGFVRSAATAITASL
jgi:hypothetical protein